MKPGKTGIARIINATGYSLKGLKACYRGEAAFRQELLLVLVLTPLSFWVAENAVEWILLAGSLLILLIVELLNSAIESVVDRFGDERHVLSGRAKDMGSAAVLLSLLLITIVWAPLLWGRLENLT